MMRNISQDAGGLTELMFHMATAEMATDQTMTSSQAADLLRQNAQARTLREVLSSYTAIPAEKLNTLQSFLTEAIMAQSPCDTLRSSVERKVRMWLADDVHCISKQGAIQLCFALAIPVEQAGEFLCRSCGENFHWRDPHDIIFLFALREGMDYQGALALERDMAEKNLLNTSPQSNGEILTNVVRQSVEILGNVQELEDLLRDLNGQLGSMHNTAYDYFSNYIQLLSQPYSWAAGHPEGEQNREKKHAKGNDDLPADSTMPVREINDVYLYNKLVPHMKKTKDKDAQARMLSAIERDVQRNWPDETVLSKMVNRKTDVSRKVLILLFLATDGDTPDSVTEDDYWSRNFIKTHDLDSRSAADQWRERHENENDFEDLYARMNVMLADCGFAQLDPRSPFDWMILYCMCGAESLTIDQRVQDFLSALFQNPVDSEELET